MKMSEEMAVRLHRMMWSDMQKELGDNPTYKERAQFKFAWIHKLFPDESIANDCWLCEYAASVTEREPSGPYCKYCPISWPNRHCNTLDFSYTKEPISEILALPARNEKLTRLESEYIANDKETVAISYYQYREQLLSKASGMYASAAIEDHVKAIQKKAVDEYFEKTPGAKLVSMDVDDAFRQYAKEQMEPLKQQNDRLTKRYIEFKNSLALQSGLDHDRPVDDHIREIVKNSMEAGATEERDRIQEKIYEVLLS